MKVVNKNPHSGEDVIIHYNWVGKKFFVGPVSSWYTNTTIWIYNIRVWGLNRVDGIWTFAVLGDIRNIYYCVCF